MSQTNEEHVEVVHDGRDARALLLKALGQEHGTDAGDRGVGYHSQQHINLRGELERLWSGWSNIGTGALSDQQVGKQAATTRVELARRDVRARLRKRRAERACDRKSRRLGAFRVLAVAKEERGVSDEEHANVRKQRARKVDPVNRLAQQQGTLEINEDTATRRIRKDERDDRTREDDHDRVDRADDAAEEKQIAERRLDAQVEFIDADSDLAVPKHCQEEMLKFRRGQRGDWTMTVH